MRGFYGYMHRAIKHMLFNMGYVVKRSHEIHLIRSQHSNALHELLNSGFECNNLGGVIGVVFSKNRPLQLYALIKSYFEKVENPTKLKIMYAATNDSYAQAYDEVIEITRNMNVEFYKERSFKNDLVNLLRSSNEEKIFFLVDDILFIENFDMTDYIDVDSSLVVASMRLGKNLKRAYTASADQKLPSFSVHKSCVGEADKCVFEWAEGNFDWGYPLSVDGNLFMLREIKAMALIAEYQAPNTFEKSLQWFNHGFLARKGVCYEKSVIVNVPFNKVQSENKNIAGSVSEEELLNLWNKGYELDLDKYYGFINISAHQELPLYIKARN